MTNAQLKVRMAELRRALELFVRTTELPESEQLRLQGLYPTWEELVAKGQEVPARSLCRYGKNPVGDDQLYRFVSNYTPVATYNPTQDQTHYTPIGIHENGVAIWVQPYGKTDAYMAGDEVFDKGDIWVNDVDFNAFRPGVSGWHRKSSENPNPDVPKNKNGTARFSEWINPMGHESVGLYGKDDAVTYQGARKLSNYDNNGSPPSDTGWWRNE